MQHMVTLCRAQRRNLSHRGIARQPGKLGDHMGNARGQSLGLRLSQPRGVIVKGIGRERHHAARMRHTAQGHLRHPQPHQRRVPRHQI